MSTQTASPLLSHNTKKINEIFKSSESHFLIEGAPGIGKTVLVKEIAYCWANRELFVGMNLFLLFMRDPRLHSVSTVDDLVLYLSEDYLSKDKVMTVADKLKNTLGAKTIIVIDGYDECPPKSNCKRFIDKLFKGILSKCKVVITSRPTASLTLRQLAGQRIEILGLAKKEQDKYISESLKGSSEMKNELQEYLKQHPVINSFIHVPFHLALLVYLFKENKLPETLTEMNEYFIIHTVYRHLKHVNRSKGEISKITDLPEPELTTVYNLSKLAYRGLCDNQLIFTYNEFKEVCPKVCKIPGAINGFGLLQTVECYNPKGAAAGETFSLNFLHFTMQEYLAALHISKLSSEEQSSCIKKTFYKSQFSFMWLMYIGIVGLQSPCFADIVDSLQLDFTTSILFIFQCYLEGKDFSTIPKEITLIFSDGNITFSGETLLPHHIMSLIVFMMKSTTKWKSLDFNRCSIGCKGMHDLTKFFNDFKEKLTTVKSVNLRSNDLTSIWEMHRDNVTETALLSVESLDLSCNNFNDTGAKDLFSALHDNKKLRKLNFSLNNLTVDATTTISKCLQFNKALHELDLSDNSIADEGSQRLAEAIKENTTLRVLNISKNWISKEGVLGILKACTKNRTLHELICVYNNLSKPALASIDEYIEKEKAVKIFDAS